MSEGMKMLVITTCMVLIGGTAYFVLADRSDRANQEEAAKAYLERSALRETCRQRTDAISHGQLSGDDILILQDCASSGIISSEEFKHSIAQREERLGG